MPNSSIREERDEGINQFIDAFIYLSIHAYTYELLINLPSR